MAHTSRHHSCEEWKAALRLPISGSFFSWTKFSRGKNPRGKIFRGERTVKGYNIVEESYHHIGKRTIACTLILENGYEISGTYCIDLTEMVYEDLWKRKAFQQAYDEYERIQNVINRQTLFSILPSIEERSVING
jgi:hypothetical protein